MLIDLKQSAIVQTVYQYTLKDEVTVTTVICEEDLKTSPVWSTTLQGHLHNPSLLHTIQDPVTCNRFFTLLPFRSSLSLSHKHHHTSFHLWLPFIKSSAPCHSNHSQTLQDLTMSSTSGIPSITFSEAIHPPELEFAHCLLIFMMLDYDTCEELFVCWSAISRQGREDTVWTF